MHWMMWLWMFLSLVFILIALGMLNDLTKALISLNETLDEIGHLLGRRLK